MGTPAVALPVPEANALRVARNAIREHLAWFGTWGGSTTPHVIAVEPVELDGNRLAFNVAVEPKGHLLIAADDELSAVLLYSDVSPFDPTKVADPESFESWIVPEIGAQVRALKGIAAARPAGTRPQGWEVTATGRSWRHFDVPEGSFLVQPRKGQTGQTASPSGPESSASSVGPLLATNWTQSSPYNNDTPADTTCTHTLAGCVAIAVTQIMRVLDLAGLGNWQP